MKNAAYLLLFFLNIALGLNAKEPSPTSKGTRLLYPDLVARLYLMGNNQYIWYGAGESAALRREFVKILDSAGVLYGLDKQKYHYQEVIKFNLTTDTLKQRKSEMVFTDAIIAFFKDLYQGGNIMHYLSNDEVSPVYANADNEAILTMIFSVRSVEDMRREVNSMEPAGGEYKVIKNLLISASDKGSRLRIAYLK